MRSPLICRTLQRRSGSTWFSAGRPGVCTSSSRGPCSTCCKPFWFCTCSFFYFIMILTASHAIITLTLKNKGDASIDLSDLQLLFSKEMRLGELFISSSVKYSRNRLLQMSSIFWKIRCSSSIPFGYNKFISRSKHRPLALCGGIKVMCWVRIIFTFEKFLHWAEYQTVVESFDRPEQDFEDDIFSLAADALGVLGRAELLHPHFANVLF